jgi:ATP-dependent DNA helicase DinG
MVSVRDVLAERSPLARSLSGYQHREGQLAMAEAVEASLFEERALLVEAGTGTGKTLAYLVPAILSGKKVVVSTATRALQEQIYFKDLPIVAEVLAAYGIKFRAALMKGLSNYLCRRRLHEALLAGDVSFRLKQWSEETESGDRSELADLAEDDPAWAAVMSGTDTRIGSECHYFDECFVTRMKQDAERADIVVVNHHLFCADLVLRRNQRERASAIPAYDAVIFDEAHQLEDVATTFFGSSISTARIDSLARDARRAMPPAQSLLAQPIADQLSEAGRAFFWELARSLRDDPPQSMIPSSRGTSSAGRRAIAEHEWTGDLLGARNKLESALGAIAHDARTRSGPSAEQIARRAFELIEVLAGKAARHEIAWIEHRGHAVVMGRSPVFVGDVLAESLFGRVRSVIATSATLTTPGEEGARSFDFLKERLGVPHDARSLAVASPFDFENRAAMYVPRDVPDPTDARFEEAAAQRAIDLIEITGGGAFVLCTSVRSMRALYSRLSRAKAETNATWGPLLVQGEKPKSLLLSQFRAAEHAVLVATMSFWEGVDVPGHALRLVVLDKIPFAVPSDPIVAARCELIERQGLNAFYKYSVPTAAISLKQGFGRLLRNETDYGLVALLDRRALTKPYGRALLQSLPPAKQLRTIPEVQKFWMHIDHDLITNSP